MDTIEKHELWCKILSIQKELDTLYDKEYIDNKLQWRVSRKIDALAQEKMRLKIQIENI